MPKKIKLPGADVQICMPVRKHSLKGPGPRWTWTRCGRSSGSGCLWHRGCGRCCTGQGAAWGRRSGSDAAGFDIRDHVRARPVPAPGDETVLLQVCAELNTGRMDRSRPLRQVWLLTGLAGGRAGLFILLHYVVAHGIAALALLGALFDPDPAAPAAALPAGPPEPVPAARELS